MARVQVYDFGEVDGVKVYRVSGDKEDLERIVDECRKEDAKFDESPEISHIRKGQWTMLLKLKVAVEVGDGS